MAVGQPAAITLDALPDNPLAGQVVAIAPDAIPSGSGVTSYEVTVALRDEHEPVRVGMTANVGIETGRRENVLIIPAHLVQVNQLTGETYVNKLTANGQIAPATVTLGLRSGQNIEVLTGLQTGDQVMAPSLAVQAEVDPSEPGGGLLSRIPSMHNVANQAQTGR